MATATEQAPAPASQPIPPDVDGRLKRGRQRLEQVAPRRRQAVEFANGRHYSELSEDGLKLTKIATTAESAGGDRPEHRVRRSHDILGPILKRKISVATQSDPDYESLATTTDFEKFGAARLAEKIARVGYERWYMRQADKKALWNALVTEEAFVGPVWDSKVGPFIDVSQHPEDSSQRDPENPRYVGMGEVAIMVYSGLEVMWEPGVDFEKSRWYAIEHARPVEEVEAEEGFVKPAGAEKLRADALSSSEIGNPRPRGANLCIVTEYLERPSPKRPKGRRMVFANGRQIFEPDDYPKVDENGQVVDRPPLHRLTYEIDGTSDRGKGLVPSLIDPIRQFDMALNKQAEYAQLGLVPQLLAAEGVIVTDITDEPGLIVEFDVTAANGSLPQWRDNVPFPQELFQMEDRARQRISEISFDTQIPHQVESGKGIASIVEKDAIAWQDFLDEFDAVRGAVMRDCLALVQCHYTDERMVKFRGHTGWEDIKDFRGTDLLGQIDVRLKPGSTQAMTRPQLEQRIMNIVTMFPGFFPPEVVIAALNSATPESLIEGYEEDQARAYRIINQIRSGPKLFWRQPDRPVLPGEEAPELDARGNPIPDGNGGFVMLKTVPGWLPRPFDNIPVQKAVFERWMKSDEWDELPDESKQASLFYYQALLEIEARHAKRTAELQSAMAEQLGMQNAAAPQGAKPMPSQPALSGPGSGGTPATQPPPAGATP